MSLVMAEILLQHMATALHLMLEFFLHQLWLTNIYYRFYWGAALAMMTEQMNAVAMYQMQIVGSFLDAKHQMETQRLLAALTAVAMKDYYPSAQLCSIGSAARSLFQADRNTALTARLMGQRAIERQLLNANANASQGPREDREGRVEQFIARYCDRNDNSLGLAQVCAAGVAQARRNKDIDYGRTVAQPWTLNIDFSNAATTEDEEDVLAMAANLYAHDVLPQVSGEMLRGNPSAQATYLDLRAIVAKRSVAEQSFRAITAMKARGASDAAETARYLRAIMRQLGIASDADVDAIIGLNPSYYAQMEILTKKLFQTPDFFIDLYDKPANAARKSAALEALGLMQENDVYNSALRSEQMMSILLELRLEKEQEYVQNKIGRMLK